ncbi:ABC transporter ATP-binding protein [Halobiforma nitratireducens]|uniref:Nickel import system ATP-binding protein NikD n=1 Tax=Halobiforma nitratireducens JCM 10879 TaxID=1227454 RepID=M0LD88_9EURY|nr:ABC transporter ATP-binding protein [Halobiforma nitratireducens]EMA31073.1 oligopeptide/dipeptide ABC transporter ATP-binding protein [Halobiforma nitratireducens JCM 10879]
MTMTDDPLLSIRNLQTYFHTDDGVVKAVDGVSFDVDRGETVCIVGESGSGKSVTSESITQLIPIPPGEIVGGEVYFDGEDVTELSTGELQELRGGRIGHVFQNPQGALNPVYTVGYQIREAIDAHHDLSKAEARQRAIRLLEDVGIPEAATRIDDYPHEFSGGMKQRVVIAIALACEPDLLIADEPTTALDVTIEAQILDLLRDLQDEYDMSIVFITHDLGVVAEIADRVVVMYAGKVMETGSVEDIFENSAHPYTEALLECLPGQSNLEPIPGTLPSATDPPDGCRFHDRCEYATEECRVGDQPALSEIEDGHGVSCVHWQRGSDGLPEPTDVRGPVRSTGGER